jgi:hypothetical protein
MLSSELASERRKLHGREAGNCTGDCTGKRRKLHGPLPGQEAETARARGKNCTGVAERSHARQGQGNNGTMARWHDGTMARWHEGAIPRRGDATMPR